MRVPEARYRQLKEYAASQNISLNSVVSEAIAQYGSKLERAMVIADISDFQRQLQQRCKARKTKGEGANSVETLRMIREARSMHLGSKSGSAESHGGPDAPGAGKTHKLAGRPRPEDENS